MSERYDYSNDFCMEDFYDIELIKYLRENLNAEGEKNNKNIQTEKIEAIQKSEKSFDIHSTGNTKQDEKKSGITDQIDYFDNETRKFEQKYFN